MMKNFPLYLKYSLLLSLFVMLAACAAPPVKRRILYPPLPDQPRVEWLGTFHDERDFEKKGARRVLAEIAGDAPAEAFDGPVGVAVNSQGVILVSDLYLQTIVGVDIPRTDIYPVSKEKSFRNNLGIVVDRQDRIFVADGKARKVFVLSPKGDPLYAIGDETVFGKPAYLAINHELGRLYVSDPLQHKVKAFALDGKFLFEFGGPGGDPGRFNVPQGIAIDKEGKLFVADMLNSRIQVFTADGQPLHNFGARGTGRNQFETPKALAFDSEGHLYVVDSRRPNYRIFNPDGQLLLEVGSNRRDDTSKLALGLPVAIHIDNNDRIVIADLMNRQIAVWQYLSRRYLKDHPL